MSILPKVYRFVWMTKDDRPSTSYIVARNETNAEKLFKQLSNESKKKDKVDVYIYMSESWLANVLALFLPKYIYRGGKWSEWKRMK